MISLHRQPNGRRITGALLAAVFTLGFAVTFLHADAVEHTYCVTHQQVTHDDSHEQGAESERVAHADAPESDRDGESPDEHDPNGCEWLTWLKSNSSPLADLHPHLLVLSPPAEPSADPIPAHHQFAREPIARHHVSPINSPPAG